MVRMRTTGFDRQAVPPELAPWLPELPWSREELQALDLPIRDVPIGELAWMLDLPCWPGGDAFEIRPLDVVDGPQLERTNAADLSQPLLVTRRHGRLVVLDGLHGLLKAARARRSTVRVREVPPDALRRIAA
jgi:hypothetical protein